MKAARTDLSRWQRWRRGLGSSATAAWLWVGAGARRRLEVLRSQERLEQGLVIVLPGIDGESHLNHSIAWGLVDGGLPHSIEIQDWTTGSLWLALYHLRAAARHAAQAQRIAGRIRDYQTEFPGRPVYLVGHSAGGAMAVRILELLDQPITGAVLLAAALSPRYSLASALSATQRGIWNFTSRGDWFFLVVGTLLFATVDGAHTVSAGAIGFRTASETSEQSSASSTARLREQPWKWRMARSFNLAGHFGCTNRVFVAEWVAPLLQ